MQRFRLCAVWLALLLVPVPGHAAKHPLPLVKKIGAPAGASFEWMSFVAFNHEGTEVVSDRFESTGKDPEGGLSFWSFPAGRLLKQLPFIPDALSGDWKYYALKGAVVDMATGRPVMSFAAGSGAAFSPDSRYVAELSGAEHGNGPNIHIFELSSGKQISAFESLRTWAVAFSPDNRTFASGHWDAIKLWDTKTGKRLGVLHGVGRYAVGLTFSRDGRLLAVGTDAGGLQIWDVRRRRLLHSVDVYGGEVSVPAFSPDGRLVAAGAYGEGLLTLVDVASGRIVHQQQVSDLGCGSVAFSPNGRFLITPSTGGLITWPYDEGGTIRVFRVR